MKRRASTSRASARDTSSTVASGLNGGLNIREPLKYFSIARILSAKKSGARESFVRGIFKIRCGSDRGRKETRFLDFLA